MTSYGVRMMTVSKILINDDAGYDEGVIELHMM